MACVVIFPALILGCAGGDGNSGAAPSGTTAGAAADSAPAPAAPAGERRVVLFLGTSLTAGPGLEPEQTYPAFLQQKIDSAGLPFEAINAGVSGETAAGARQRLGWLLRQPFDVLVIETGANDMLRGARVSSIRQQVQEIVDTVRAERPDVPIVLAGMQALPNLGEQYGREYRQMYVELAEKNDLALIPFLLEGVAAVPALNLDDGIHPNEQGHRLLARNVWPTLEPVLRRAAAGTPAAASAEPTPASAEKS